jgi:hypothetical protein
LHYFKAYFRNAAKDAKKEMNEINLKFCLNALIQLLDKWGGGGNFSRGRKYLMMRITIILKLILENILKMKTLLKL